jgi:hypothetical protein
MATRALIFLGLYRRLRSSLPTWQLDTVRVIARMIAKSEQESTRQYVHSLPDNTDLNVRSYNSMGHEIFQDVCPYYEYLQVLTVGTDASRNCNVVSTGPTRRDQYPFGFCIELQKSGTVVYGNVRTQNEGSDVTREGKNESNVTQNTLELWKFVGNENINCGSPQQFAITAINRMYFISCVKSVGTIVTVLPKNRSYIVRYKDPKFLQLQPGDLIQVGTDDAWITYRFWQYKIAPIDIPIRRYIRWGLICSRCMHELIIDITDVFWMVDLADKSPSLIDGIWCCPKCNKALPSQEMFSLPVTNDEWC